MSTSIQPTALSSSVFISAHIVIVDKEFYFLLLGMLSVLFDVLLVVDRSHRTFPALSPVVALTVSSSLRSDARLH